MKKGKSERNQIIVIVVLFVALIIGFSCYTGYIQIFNNTERIYKSDMENNNISLTLGPRTGQTDSWVKNFEENGQNMVYKGVIYDLSLENLSDCKISNWGVSLTIPEDCYLNNAWCGTVDIHQNVAKNHKWQNIDLRNYKESDLTIDYFIASPDLMIPLSADDYVVYHPEKSANEFPVEAGINEKATQVVVGMIFYTTDDKPIEFSEYEVKYYLQKDYAGSLIFNLLLIGCFIWIILVAMYISVKASMRQVHKRFIQDEHIIQQSIEVCTQFFEAKDTYTNGHSKRVAEYSKMIAYEMGFSDDECRKIYYVASMHDCGKCYIPDNILKKPGKLTKEEYEIIKSHTVKGAEMVNNFTSLEHIRDGVLYHHERYDGKGYPEGLAGEKIPFISRLICVSDSFDAMNSRRCYRDILRREYIISELKNNSGTQFDPKIINAFLKLIDDGKIKFTN